MRNVSCPFGDETRSCGTILPEFGLNGAGQLVTGGSKVLIEIPNSVWEAPTIPKLQSRGRIAGYKLPRRLHLVPEVQRSPAGKGDYRWASSVAGSATPDIRSD